MYIIVTGSNRVKIAEITVDAVYQIGTFLAFLSASRAIDFSKSHLRLPVRSEKGQGSKCFHRQPQTIFNLFELVV